MNRNILIIAEKPSVAKAIAAALGVNRKAGAYLYGNGYIVSWCFGHMLEFASPESYDKRYEKMGSERSSHHPAGMEDESHGRQGSTSGTVEKAYAQRGCGLRCQRL